MGRRRISYFLTRNKIKDGSEYFGPYAKVKPARFLLDTLKQIESYLLMRHYDGLMKSGRISGRTPVSAL